MAEPVKRIRGGNLKKARGKMASRGRAAKKPAGRSKTAKSAPPKPARKPPADPLARARRQVAALKAELAAAEARIDELQAWADTDFLLNIYNRRGFERELDRSIAYIRRYKASGALIVLDVDRLKPINDTFGHAAGDIVLKGVVAVLMRHVRSSDVVGRLGGDEFGLLLWNLTEADALAKAAALEQAIDQLTFVFKGRPVVAGASAGIALIGTADSAADVMEAADRAMYARKALRRGGRAQVAL
ncbi:GGDEF domain-containing protein [Afipia broomeae]|uniref:diguanylate cyclase n=1 Tax=Afipia broomeae ATCC 49717 TaxID=883078 RepID=K8P8A2_9BRAD|nr:GGDEF domain-containing protein [Afipia broomeae]EKS37024.1 diguanylate cyclase (GGDEF) domain-containing protein [Afipia broomeae ATCC 49717]